MEYPNTFDSATQAGLKFNFCCLKNNYNTNCKLKNTQIRSTNIPLEPENICTIDNSSKTNIYNAYYSSGFNRKSWFDTIDCSIINDSNLNPDINNLKCFDDLFTLKCMTSDINGIIDYTKGKIFSQDIKGCIFNMPLLKFFSTSFSAEISNIDFIIDLNTYIDSANLLEGFIFSIYAYDSGNVDITNNLSFDFKTLKLTVPKAFQSQMFPGSNVIYLFNLKMIDAYERYSTNFISITLKLNKCPKFSKQSPINDIYYNSNLNSYVVYDISNISNSILSSYTQALTIIKNPQLKNPPYFVFSNNSKIEIKWQSSDKNVYIPDLTVTIRLSLTCPGLTENTFDYVLTYKEELLNIGNNI